MSELAILQAVRLKGRLDAAAAAICTGLTEDAAATGLTELLDRELVKGGPAYRITPGGREHLVALVMAERAAVDQDALRAAYNEFDAVNHALKEVITAWQMRDADTPNDHTDADYDAAVLTRLHQVDALFGPVLDRVLTSVARLSPYRPRFANALARVDAGDTTFVARPITDSYHTVWFEFHEELIGLLGLSRAEEAAAGRAL